MHFMCASEMFFAHTYSERCCQFLFFNFCFFLFQNVIFCWDINDNNPEFATTTIAVDVAEDASLSNLFSFHVLTRPHFFLQFCFCYCMQIHTCRLSIFDSNRLFYGIKLKISRKSFGRFVDCPTITICFWNYRIMFMFKILSLRHSQQLIRMQHLQIMLLALIQL